MKIFLLLLFSAIAAAAQLAITVSPPKVTGQKAVVRLDLKNNFKEEIKSARAAIFLLDQNGEMVGQGTRWVIGGDKGKSGLPPGSTNSFYFTLTGSQPFSTTNLTAKVTFERIVLEGNRVADLAKDVVIKK